MTLTRGAERRPIKLGDDGVARVGGTRVTLDTVIAAYEREQSAEKIVDQYDVLTLADVYYAMGYYLSHRAEVDDYLAARERRAEKIRQENEARFDRVAVKERLLDRQE